MSFVGVVEAIVQRMYWVNLSFSFRLKLCSSTGCRAFLEWTDRPQAVVTTESPVEDPAWQPIGNLCNFKMWSSKNDLPKACLLTYLILTTTLGTTTGVVAPPLLYQRLLFSEQFIGKKTKNYYFFTSTWNDSYILFYINMKWFIHATTCLVFSIYIYVY